MVAPIYFLPSQEMTSPLTIVCNVYWYKESRNLVKWKLQLEHYSKIGYSDLTQTADLRKYRYSSNLKERKSKNACDMLRSLLLMYQLPVPLYTILSGFAWFNLQRLHILWLFQSTLVVAFPRFNKKEEKESQKFKES